MNELKLSAVEIESIPESLKFQKRYDWDAMLAMADALPRSQALAVSFSDAKGAGGFVMAARSAFKKKFRAGKWTLSRRGNDVYITRRSS